MADDALARAAGKHARAKATSKDSPCVLFAVISGTNALYDTLGDARALMIINRCLNLMESQVYETRGTVIKTISNQLMTMFPDANNAGSAAISMQQSIEHFAQEASVSVGIRVGLRSGPVIEEAGDIFGDAVNIAARLVKLAAPGQIITDGDSLAAMRATLRKKAREIDRRHLKGKRSEIEIVEIGWRRRAGEPFATEQSAFLERQETAKLKLSLNGREIIVDDKREAFTLGRDATNDLSVRSRKASRIHARIEWQRDKFVLLTTARMAPT